MGYIVALLILSLIVTFHEFGHFIFAKLFGIKVEEFAVGMGPKIISHKSKKSDTLYSIRLLPIGGFCAMKGESGEPSDDEDSFSHASVWKRILIVLAGPVFNLLLGLIVAMILVVSFGFPLPFVTNYMSQDVIDAGLQPNDIIVNYNGVPITTATKLSLYTNLIEKDTDTHVILQVLRNDELQTISYEKPLITEYIFGLSYENRDDGICQISELTDDGSMKKAGFEVGDIITKIDDIPLTKGMTFAEYVAGVLDREKEREYKITYMRGTEEHETIVTPTKHQYYDIGFEYNTARIHMPVKNVFKSAIDECGFALYSTIESVKLLVTGQVKLNDMSGPIGIVDIMHDSVDGISSAVVNPDARTNGLFSQEFSLLLLLIILITVNLGVMNLLPIPALDGGHLLFYIVEILCRKPVPRKVEQGAYLVSMLALFTFMIFLTFQDVMKIAIR